MENMNLSQIIERLAALDIEVRDAQDIETVEKLGTEKKELLERKAELETLEKRKQTALDITSGKVEAKIVESRKGEKNMDFNKDNVIATPEYRSAFLKRMQGNELNDVEKRALTSAADSVGGAIPTQTQDEVLKKLKQYAPLLGEITLLQVAGNVKFVVEGVINESALHTEGATITASADTLITVSLGGYEVNKLVTISKSVATMSINAFEGWLTDMLAEAIANKISSYLIVGTGTNQPQGINTAQTWTADNSVSVALAGSLTAANVQALCGLLPGGYDNGGKFLMSKKTLFTDFMPLQDNSKHALVTKEGTEYFVYGYSVLFDERVTYHEAFLGNFKKAIVGNLAESVNVASAFDIKTNSFDYLGSAIFDSKVAIGEAVVKLVKATA